MNMAKRTPERELEAIEATVRRHPDGIGIRDIAGELGKAVSHTSNKYVSLAISRVSDRSSAVSGSSLSLRL